MRLRYTAAAAVVSIGLGSVAQGFIIETLKAEFSVQTSGGSNPTLVPDGWRFDARATNVDVGEFNSATVTIPVPPGDGTALPLVQEPPPRDNIYGYKSTGTGTQTELDAAFPSGDYTFTYTGGTLDGLFDVLTSPEATSYPSVRPQLLGSTYNELQDYVPGESISASWEGFTFEGFSGASFLQIFRTSDGAEVFGARFGTGAVSATILPANLALPIEPGQSYSLSLSYSVFGSGDTPENQSGAAGASRFERRTFIPFTAVVPEPTCLGLIPVAAAGLARRRR